MHGLMQASFPKLVGRGDLLSMARRHKLCHGPSGNAPLLFVRHRLSSINRPTFIIQQPQALFNSLASANHALFQPLSSGRNLSSFVMVGKHALPAAEPNERQHCSDSILSEETVRG